MTAVTPKELAEYRRQWNIADQELSDILDRVHHREGNPSGVLFSFWCHLTQLLATKGWDADDLATQVHLEHAAGTTFGPMQ